MPHIDSIGVVHRERPMEYGDYVSFLREGLISATGTAESEDLLYAGQSARSGAGSSPTRGQIWRKDARRHSSGHSSSRSGPPRPLRGLCSCCLGSCVYLGGRAPHPEGTWPKTLLHKPMGVASTEGGGLARRPNSEIDRLAAKGRGIWAVRSGGQYQQVRTRVEVASRLWAPGGHKTFNFKSNALRGLLVAISQEPRI